MEGNLDGGLGINKFSPNAHMHLYQFVFIIGTTSNTVFKLTSKPLKNLLLILS
jgi:hypothetical protein